MNLILRDKLGHDGCCFRGVWAIVLHQQLDLFSIDAAGGVLISSVANLIPLTEEIPKFAVEPVVDMKTPIRTLSPLLPAGWRALSKLAITIEAIRMRFIQILTGLEFLANLGRTGTGD